MRETRSLTDAREIYVIRFLDWSIIVRISNFIFRKTSPLRVISFLLNHFPSRDGIIISCVDPFLAFPSRNLFQIECVARSSTNRNDAWPQKRLLFTRLTPLVQVDEVESARMQLYIYVRAVYFKRSALSLILLNGIYLRSKQIARS